MILKFKNILGEFNFTLKFKLSEKQGNIIVNEKNIFEYKEVLHYFKDIKFLKRFYEKNLELTKKKLKASLNEDYHVIELVKEVHRLRKASRSIHDLSLKSRILTKIKQKFTKLEQILSGYCPNLTQKAGVFIAAELIFHARSLKRLARMPSSKIQILGAEKSFFKYLTKKGKLPKHGVIARHRSVKDGKTARLLANKIAIAARKDYFR